MALYKIVLERRVVKKDLPKLPKKDASRVMERIGKLADNPRPPQATKLSNREEYRLRQGNCRILYIIDDVVNVVDITHIGHRGEVYQ